VALHTQRASEGIGIAQAMRVVADLGMVNQLP